MKRFTILGAGIGGLTLAIALKKIGIRADVYEAASAIKPVGAGILMAANAIQGFHRLGVAEKIMERGCLLPYFEIKDQRGRTISSADAGIIARKFGMHNFAIHRADLHAALLAELDADQTHTGFKALGFKQETDGTITVLFDQKDSISTDYLIAADGIHSAVRKQLLPETSLRYSGYTCWRAVIDAPHIDCPNASETWGASGRFGIVPLENRRFYWFACVNALQNDPAMRNISIETLRNIFGQHHQPIPAMLEATRQADLIWGDICDLGPTPHFAFGNVALLGDAAHATTPNLGQGACQAIEDAVVLADEIKKQTDIVAAFKSYEQRRFVRAQMIVNQSWRLGKVAQISNPILAGLRNTLLRLVPERINEAQVKSLLTVDF
ncbi:MAG: FAD-dependent monooxygenase [Bacteroidota bacterium]